MKLQIHQQSHHIFTGCPALRKTTETYKCLIFEWSLVWRNRGADRSTLLWPQTGNSDNKQLTLLTATDDMSYELTANLPFNICNLASPSRSAPSTTFTAVFSRAAVMLLQSVCLKSPVRNKLARNVNALFLKIKY